MSRELDRYLSRATRGLWGKAKRDARAELASHVFERTRALITLGLSESEAQHRALRELGSALTVSSELVRVHTAPLAVRSAALAALVTLAAFTGAATLTRGVAQVDAYVHNDPLNALAFLDVEGLRDALDRQGATLSASPQQVTVRLPGGETVQIPLPGGEDRELELIQRDGRAFLNATRFVYALEQAGLPLTLEGWHNPTLHVGETALQLGSKDAPLDAYALFNFTLSSLVLDLEERVPLVAQRWSNPGARSTPYTLKVNEAPGTVMGVAVAWEGVNFKPGRALLFTDVAPVAADGTVTLKLPPEYRNVRFTSDLNGVKRDIADLKSTARPASLGQAGQPAHAVLLKLTGRLGFTDQRYTLVPNADRLPSH